MFSWDLSQIFDLSCHYRISSQRPNPSIHIPCQPTQGTVPRTGLYTCYRAPVHRFRATRSTRGRSELLNLIPFLPILILVYSRMISSERSGDRVPLSAQVATIAISLLSSRTRRAISLHSAVTSSPTWAFFKISLNIRNLCITSLTYPAAWERISLSRHTTAALSTSPSLLKGTPIIPLLKSESNSVRSDPYFRCVLRRNSFCLFRRSSYQL